MENKIRETKFWTLFWLFLGILSFITFCFDLENNKDWYTYGWLLYTILSFCMFIIQGVKLEILRSKNDTKN